MSTIYDYFPNKHAILVAMAREELGRTFQSIQNAVAAAKDEDAKRPPEPSYAP